MTPSLSLCLSLSLPKKKKKNPFRYPLPLFFLSFCSFISTVENKEIADDIRKEIDILKKCKNPSIVSYYGNFFFKFFCDILRFKK